MKMLFSLIITLLSTSAFAQVGFRSGSDFQVLRIQGNVQVQCRAPNGAFYYRYLQCQGMVAYPNGYDYLTTDQSIDADHVELTNLQQNGYQQMQSSRYNTGTNQSTSAFNLLMPSYQNPLLALGMNEVSYTFTKNGAPVTSGQFTVNVTSLGMHQCFNQNLYDGTDYYCYNPNEACRQYFQMQNWCQ